MNERPAIAGLRAAFPDTSALRTYATHEHALQALTRAAAKAGVTDMVYLIASTGTGRFFPVALPGKKEIQNGIALARHGISAFATAKLILDDPRPFFCTFRH